MTIAWSILPPHVREGLKVLGIGPGSLIYIRKLNDARRAHIAQEYATLRSAGLGHGAALAVLAGQHQRHPRTISRYLSAAGGAR